MRRKYDRPIDYITPYFALTFSKSKLKTVVSVWNNIVIVCAHVIVHQFPLLCRMAGAFCVFRTMPTRVFENYE